jgi:fatty acid/phospholipid synthesis protein PlsX
VAIRTKKNSSLVRACERVKEDEKCIGMVSAGSTGAVLTGATLKIGRIRGISRPALAPLLPTVNGSHVLLCDCGANVDCKSNMLYQFAMMGKAYMQSVCNIENPRIGLLCNGTEDKKGNELTHETFALLKADKSFNFVGNMEARELLSGDYDVVVCDGFDGNIALKSAEGTAKMMMKLLKNEMMSSFKNKIGAALLKKSFMNVKNLMDYNKSGGAVFLGVIKPVVKAHGASRAESICGSILQVLEMHRADFIGKLSRALNENGSEAE